MLLSALSLGYQWLCCLRSVVGSAWWLLLMSSRTGWDPGEQISVSIPVCCGCWGKELLQALLSCQSIPSLASLGIKGTGLLLLPSPRLLLSFLFLLLPLLSFLLLLFSAGLPCDGEVLLVIEGLDVAQQPMFKHQDRVAEPLSLPTPPHCEQLMPVSSPGPSPPLAETPARDDAQRRAKIVLRRRMNGRKKGT